MSLLLDALKKAAEQKAEKEEESGSEGAVSAESRGQDETESELVMSTDLSLDPAEADPAVILQDHDSPVSIDSEDVTDLGEETMMGIFDEDQTMVLTDDDVTSFLGDHESQANPAESITPDEDLSLLLVDEEGPTELLDEGPKTGSLEASTEVQLLADLQTSTNHLNLRDLPEQGQTDDEDHTVVVRADQSVITVDNLGESTKTEGLGLREQTSTRTYAPDNYDRTLVKVSDEDASGLFSGMKSDSGAAMTPEHAKTVFVSKFSSQRVYNYKIYAAIAVCITLVIAILAMFELQQKSFDIDTALRPLKRDPMPGVIKIASSEEPSTTLFDESEQAVVDALTLQLVEDAEMVIDTGTILNQDVEQEQNLGLETTETQSSENEAMESNKLVQQTVVSRIQPVNQINVATTTPKLEKAPNPQLQITTSNTISDKDRWLRQAYAAYQRGDDKTALEKYSQVLKVDPSNRNALLARAAIYIQNNNVNAAIRDYQTLLLANPKDSLAMASLVAVANYSPEVAESQLKILIRDEPDSPYLNFALANVYGTQNRWMEAQGLYFAALENNPDDPNYAYNLAVSLEHIEKPEVAIAYYERALDNINNGLATFNRDVVDQRLEWLKQL